jgi:hypothetical protein
MNSLYEYQHDVETGWVDCELEYEPEDQGSDVAPGYPESLVLWSARVHGVDITELLSEKAIDEIVDGAYEQMKKDAEEDFPEPDYDD